MRSFRIGVLGAALALTLGACGPGGGADEGGQITIGAVNFAENQIVAEMYALVLEEAGYAVTRRFNFERREELQPAVRAGEVDLAPEYLASLLIYEDPNAQPSPDPEENAEALEPLLQRGGVELLDPSDANDTNALVVTQETARRHRLSEVSDLRRVDDELIFGGPPECPQRRFCLRGLKEAYGLDFERFVPLDVNGPLTVAALSSGEIDVALLFSTSPEIAQRQWVLLEDDRELQAADNITPVIRTEASNDEIEKLLGEVSDSLTTRNMTRLNAAVEVQAQDFTAVARDFLRDQGLLDER